MSSSSPKAYLSEVRVGWYFLVRFISSDDLVHFSSICLKHVNADIEKKKRIRYRFINSMFQTVFLSFKFLEIRH